MSDSLWNFSAEELLRRASSVDPTPGGGSVAAVTAAFGFSLVQMAIGVTLADLEPEIGAHATLVDAIPQIRAWQSEAVAAVDRDVIEFDAVMAAYRLPRESEAERAARRQAIDAATVTATRGPLGLVEVALDGITLVDQIEGSIKASILSDAQAGRDLLRGAALAALRTADINLVALEQRDHAEAPALRQRRDAAGRRAGAMEDMDVSQAD